jgi:hypothetical protein
MMMRVAVAVAVAVARGILKWIPRKYVVMM